MERPTSSEVTLEDLIRELGTVGKFQVINFILTCLPVVYSAVSALSYVFAADVVDHRCLVPECESASSAIYDAGQSWLPFAVGYTTVRDESILRQCSRFRPADSTPKPPPVNASSPNASQSTACSVAHFSDRSISCEKYVFDESVSTIVNEWELVCDDSWKRAMVGTANSLGQLAGLPLAGMISDRVGRRTVLAGSCCLSALLGIARSFAPTYFAYVLLEFVEPVLGVGIFTSSFILCMELTCTRGRVVVGVAQCLSFALGEVALGLMAWALLDWRQLLRFGYAPGVAFIVYRWVLPEPVRWLMARGQPTQARVMLERAARQNGVVFDEDRLQRVFGADDAEEEKKKVSGDAQAQVSAAAETTARSSVRLGQKPATISDVLRSSVLVCRTIACCYCWVTNTFLFYGLSLFSVSFRGHKHRNFILAAIVEMPAYICMMFIAERLGRRRCLATGLVLASLGCFGLMVPLPKGFREYRVGFVLVSKFSITLAFSTLYVYTAELFPTPVRHSLLSFCSMVGRVGSIVAPMTPLLASLVHPLLPLGLFGAMGLLAAALALLLPETVRAPLPTTVADAERLGSPGRRGRGRPPSPGARSARSARSLLLPEAGPSWQTPPPLFLPPTRSALLDDADASLHSRRSLEFKAQEPPTAQNPTPRARPLPRGTPASPPRAASPAAPRGQAPAARPRGQSASGGRGQSPAGSRGPSPPGSRRPSLSREELPPAARGQQPPPGARAQHPDASRSPSPGKPRR